jgi:hypothetical protein
VLGSVAQGDDWPQDLGDNVTSFSKHDGVANEDTLRSDLILVVQGCKLNFAARDQNRGKHRERSCPAGSANRNANIQEFGVHLLGWELIGNRPSWSTGGFSQFLLAGKVIDLDYHAVDFVLDLSA